MLEVRLNELEQRGINLYQASIMAAKEAHSINQKIINGIMKSQTNEKPTSIALKKLLDGRIILAEEETSEG